MNKSLSSTSEQATKITQHTQFKIGNSSLCSCAQALQTVEHTLQNRIIHETPSPTYCFNETIQEVKLYGSV